MTQHTDHLYCTVLPFGASIALFSFYGGFGRICFCSSAVTFCRSDLGNVLDPAFYFPQKLETRYLSRLILNCGHALYGRGRWRKCTAVVYVKRLQQQNLADVAKLLFGVWRRWGDCQWDFVAGVDTTGAPAPSDVPSIAQQGVPTDHSIPHRQRAVPGGGEIKLPCLIDRAHPFSFQWGFSGWF